MHLALLLASHAVGSSTQQPHNSSWPERLGKHASLLPASELEALSDLYSSCGGGSWAYANGTDAVGGGAPWRFSPSGAALGDPCTDGWFGVRCDSRDGATHVTQLFPNTRSSGNPLKCELPTTIGSFSQLEHLYTSNDVSPSQLVGPIPSAMGKLRNLRCMYFSHNNLSGHIPTGAPSPSPSPSLDPA